MVTVNSDADPYEPAPGKRFPIFCETYLKSAPARKSLRGVSQAGAGGCFP